MPAFVFNPPYRIAGQLGKGLDAASVSIEDYGIESARLSLKSHAADTLTWFHRGDTAPDWEQEVSLYDASGTRVFKGNVSAVDPVWDGPVMNGWNVTVSGPWWWLEQAQFTMLTEQDNSSWHYTPLPPDGYTPPTPIINTSDPSNITIWVPLNPWGAVVSNSLHVTVNGVAPDAYAPLYSGPIAAVAGMTIMAYASQTYGGFVYNSGVAFSSWTDHPAVTVPAQDIALSLGTLFARLGEMGVPLDLGTVALTYPFLSMTWQNASGAVILRDLLDAIPDSMTWIDYSGGGNPKLNVARRGSADIATLAIGSDLDLTGAPIALKARRELRPGYVTVQGMLLNQNGEISLVEETAGDGNGASGVLGKQYISVAGTGFHVHRSIKLLSTGGETMPEPLPVESEPILA